LIVNKNIIEQGFSWFINNSPDLIFILSDSGEILIVNKVAADFYGKDPVTLIGGNYLELLKQCGQESPISIDDLTKNNEKIVLKKINTALSNEHQYTIEWSLNNLINNPEMRAYILVGRKTKEEQFFEKTPKNIQANETTVLPLATKVGTPTILKEPSQIHGKNRILIVEDQPLEAATAQRMLHNLGYDSDIAPNGQTAIELTKQHRYALIFMDIGLPDIDGYEVTKAIREYESNSEYTVPIIGLNVHANPESKQLCLDVGMNAALTKPLVEDIATDILNAFVPSHSPIPKVVVSAGRIKSGIFTNIGKIVDFEAAKNVTGVDQEAVKNFLKMFVEDIAKDETRLDRAFYQEDWTEIQGIIRKLRGSCDYCGAIKLKEVCMRLEDYITSGKTELREIFYQQVRVEMQTLKWYIKSTIDKKN
jgi:CheY-like chemotaxis protein